MSNYNKKLNHIFIHIPKTAGSSMENQPWVGGRGHLRIQAFAEQGLDIEKIFVWCFVRNPYDRLVSAYRSHVRLKKKFIELGMPPKALTSFPRICFVFR